MSFGNGFLSVWAILILTVMAMAMTNGKGNRSSGSRPSIVEASERIGPASLKDVADAPSNANGANGQDAGQEDASREELERLAKDMGMRVVKRHPGRRRFRPPVDANGRVMTNIAFRQDIRLALEEGQRQWEMSFVDICEDALLLYFKEWGLRVDLPAERG